MESDKLTPFTKEVFGLTLKEWRVITNDSNDSDYGFDPCAYRIIAKDEQQAFEMLVWYQELLTYQQYLAGIFGDENLQSYEELGSDYKIHIGENYNGIVKDDEICPSIATIDLLEMTLEEPTYLNDWKVPWVELE